jgi:hypothetical protein
MKILMIQENGRHDKNRHFRECFSMQRSLIKLGEECDVWGLGHDNYDTAPGFNNYDLIINLENYDETNWVPDLSGAKTKKMLWAIDFHCRGAQVYLDEFDRGNYNIILQATREYVNDDSVWFPNCYDHELIKNLNTGKQYDVGFCGNIANRQAWLDFLEEQNIFSFKKDIFVIGEDMVKAINSYKVHFHKNISLDVAYRNFETMGCGTALLTSYNPQYHELGMEDGHNCFMYGNEHELMNKAMLLLEDEDLRKEIESNGELLATSRHTYDHRAEKIIQIFQNL